MKKNYMLILVSTIIIVIASIFISVLFNKKNDDNSKELETIKVSEVTHSLFYTPFYVAIENGYFESFGIDIDLTLVSGSDNVAASVLSNDTKIGLAGPESAIFVYNGGEKDYLQVFSGLTKRDGQFLMSRTKEFDWQDLKGKEILVGRSTGMPALSFFKALENKGIKKNEVNINTSIEFAELSGSFIGGEGNFVNLFEPLASKLEKNGNGYVVESVGLASNEFPYTAFYARKSFIMNNKELLTRFNKAIKLGLDYTFNNNSKDIAKVVQKQFSDTSLDDLATVIERYKNADVWVSKNYIEEEFFNTLTELLRENKLINNNIPYQDLVHNLDE